MAEFPKYFSPNQIPGESIDYLILYKSLSGAVGPDIQTSASPFSASSTALVGCGDGLKKGYAHWYVT